MVKKSLKKLGNEVSGMRSDMRRDRADRQRREDDVNTRHSVDSENVTRQMGSDIAGMKSDVGNVVGALKELRGDFKECMAELRKKDGEHDSAISSISARIGVVENDIGWLKWLKTWGSRAAVAGTATAVFAAGAKAAGAW